MSVSAELTLLENAIRPALALLPENMGYASAQLVMLTIFGQEGDFKERWQIIDLKDRSKKGPARGIAQFERGGGVRGVLEHRSTRVLAAEVCAARGVMPLANEVWLAFETDDILCAAFTRLLLWTDPGKMPAIGDEQGAWELYLRTWRPGAYSRGDEAERIKLRKKWAGYYARARAALDAVQ